MPVFAVSPNVVISQIYGGGNNAGATLTNDYVELYNAGSEPVSLDGYSIQYASSSGTSWQVTNLTNVELAPGRYYLVQEAPGTTGTATTPLPTPDATGTINMSGTTGKVALVNNQTALSGACPTDASIVDFVGFGTANCYEGAVAPAPSNTLAILRNGSDTDNNANDFATGNPNPRNSLYGVGLAGSAKSTPSAVAAGNSTLLTVTVNPAADSTNITVTADLSAIGGSSSQQFYDDATNGDATASDNTFSFSATVASGTSPGDVAMPVTIGDAQLHTASATINLTVNAPPPSAIPIHDIQGTGTTSPKAGEVATAIGIVTALKSNGFYMQAKDSDVDGDPATSEGIYVYTGSPVPTDAAVGNEVQVSGPVAEYYGLTEFSGNTNNPVSVTLLSTGNQLPSPVVLTAADTDPNGTIDQLERYESMRVQTTSLTAIAPTDGSVTESSATATSNGVFYAVVTGVPRPFREPGLEPTAPAITGMPANVPHFDGNPERLRVDSDGLAGAFKMDVATGDVLLGLTGVLDAGSSGYTLLPEPGTPAFTTAQTAVPVRAAGEREFTVASFNMERFYNDVNGDTPGATTLTSVAYQKRLSKASLVIRNVLLLPDIIGVEEVENLATLQDIADRVNTDATSDGNDPQYQPYLELGNDPSAISVGFLVKSGRVTVKSVVQEGKDATFTDPKDGSTDLLNDRPPLVLEAEVANGAGKFPVTVIVNHLRSLSSVDTADGSGDYARAKRHGQAEFLATLIQQHQEAGKKVISVGDYNAYQFNDGYVDVIGTVKGAPTPADQVLLASDDMVNPDLTDMVETVAGDQRYSYVETGNAQVLDHILVSSNLLTIPHELQFARNDADFPESLRNDETRPERISDHDMPVAYFTMPDPVPAIVISPSTLDFGEQAVNSTSAAKTIAIRNDGAAPLTIDSIVATGEFGQTNDCPASLDPAGSCTLSVTFSPTSIGGKSGTIVVTDNMPNGSQTIILSGTATAAAVPVVNLSTNTLDFGGQLVSSSSSSKTVTLSNTGNAALAINSIEVNGEFTKTHNCPASLSAGSECTISVVFAPASTGAKSGSVTISDSADGAPHTVSLTGSGTDFAFGVPQNGASSATITAGQTANYSLALSGISGFAGNVTFTCTGAPTKSTCTVSPTSKQVSSSDTSAIPVSVAVATQAATTSTAGITSIPGPGNGGGSYLLILALFGFGAVVILISRRSPKLRVAGAFAALAVAIVLSSCGSGSRKTTTIPGTAPGTYTLTVTATSGSMTHSTTLTLKVN